METSERMIAISYGSAQVDQLRPAASHLKRRKLSHAERKEELEREIRLLQSGVAVLKTRNLPSPAALQTDPVLRPAVAEYSALLYSMNTQQLEVAKLQSAMSRCLADQYFNPLYTRICLTKDWDERRAALLALRDDKIRNALAFVRTQGRDGDPLRKRFSENQFENERGDLCCVRFETIQFPGVKSLEQVYDALSFYKNNIEIIISEQLGHITLRDDYDAVEDEAFNSRMVSTNDSGITTEGNIISFRTVLGENDEGYDGEPCIVMVADSVDEDERYPYLSESRVRKELSSAVVLTVSKEHPTNSSYKAGEGDLDGDVTVTMQRASFFTIRRPDFPLTTCEFEGLRDNMLQWCDVMLKTVREILYSPRSR